MARTDSTITSLPADRESLYLMTKFKLNRFKQRKVRFEEESLKIIKRANDDNLSLIDKVRILSEGAQQLFLHENKQHHFTDFNELLAIAKASTSTSDHLLEAFSERLMKVIEGGKRRSEYNYLLGLIMSQWFSSQENRSMPVTEESASTNYLVTNERLETIIFDRPQLDLNQWRHFVQNKLFAHFDSNQELKDAFEHFKHSTNLYGYKLRTEKVSPVDVQRAMRSLINDGLLSEDRKRLMQKIQLDESAVAEFASSLTLMNADLHDWDWSVEGVRGIYRRNLVGKYRCFYEEDFLTAIFLEHLGLQWSYHFKEHLQSLFQLLTKTPDDDCSSASIQNERIVMQRQEFWMASLPSRTDESIPYDGNLTGSNGDSVSLKAKLMYLVNVEIQLHQTIRPDCPFSVVCADLEWFGPSISHEIIQILLEHCGVPPEWLQFFDRFLKQSIFYKPEEPVRQRQRGAPVSHSLSFLFAELLLFGMDLYVYQTTGIFNYRLHDDFWFFDSQTSKVEQAWTLMNEYAQMTGLKFNEEKCGSVQIRSLKSADQVDDSDVNLLLPKKNVKWGLLTLQPSGRFVVNEDLMKPFLDEMKERLTNASTILQWVNLYNQYIAFFQRNFGRCANILGTFHTAQITKAFQFIHRYVFEETDGNASTVLTKTIREQFPGCAQDEFIEAWFYWPLTQGGLGLKNIFLDLHSAYKQLVGRTEITFDQLPERDAQIYTELEEKYKQSKKYPYPKLQLASSYYFLEEFVAEIDKFMTFDEFILKRESHFPHWRDAYKKMFELPERSLPPTTSTFHTQMNSYQYLRRPTVFRYAWAPQPQQPEQVDCYQQWLLYYYGEQIESTFGRMDFVDNESLPMSLITSMKTSEINWDDRSK